MHDEIAVKTIKSDQTRRKWILRKHRTPIGLWCEETYMDSLSSQIRETSVFHAKDAVPEQSAVPVFPRVVDAL